VTIGKFRAASSILILPALLLLTAIGGCAETFDSTTIGVPVSLASAAGQQPQGTRFRVTSHAVYGFWGLAKVKDPSLRKALAAQLAGGSGIGDLRIKVRSRWSDVLVTALTGGLIVPRSVTYEGVVLK
jgi:hypothetical protein